jgi:hypothetical protein
MTSSPLNHNRYPVFVFFCYFPATSTVPARVRTCPSSSAAPRNTEYPTKHQAMAYWTLARIPHAVQTSVERIEERWLLQNSPRLSFHHNIKPVVLLPATRAPAAKVGGKQVLPATGRNHDTRTVPLMEIMPKRASVTTN